MSAKLKYEIVSWGCLVLLLACVAAMLFFAISGLQRNGRNIIALGTGAVLIMQFESWYSRRLKAQMKLDAQAEKDEKNL